MKPHIGVLKLTIIGAVVWSVGAVGLIEFKLYEYQQRRSSDTSVLLADMRCGLAAVTGQMPVSSHYCDTYFENKNWQRALYFWPTAPAILVVVAGLAVAFAIGKKSDAAESTAGSVTGGTTDAS